MNKINDDFDLNYYPEDLIFDEKTQTLKKVNSIKNAEKINLKEQKNSVFGDFSGKMMSKLFENNNIVSKILTNGFADGMQKNNVIMQALNALNSNKQKPTKVVKSEECFEEL